MSGDFTPLFKNDAGVGEIRTGARRAGCIGQTPPLDHPHVYLDIPDQGAARCPYCGVRIRFDPSLAEDECVPAEALYTPQDAG